MEGAVGAWAAVAAGIVALIALILLWRTRAELRKVRSAQRRTDAGEWRAPLSSTGPAGDATSTTEATPETTSEITASGREHTPVQAGPTLEAVETATATRDEPLQPAEAVRDEWAGEPERLEVLLELVEDEESDTRRDAVMALAGVPGPGGAERLTLILGRDPSAEVRREAVAALRGSLERRRAGTSAADA